MLVCGVPRNSAEFSRVFSVEERLFGKLALPRPAAEKIFNFCPQIWAAVFAPDGSVAAYTAAYPLKLKCADAFIAGDITEPDLTPDMMLERPDTLNGSCIYIASVVVSGEYNTLMKSTLLASLFSWRVRQLEAHAVKRISVIMTPVTDQGRRMVQAAGAKQLNSGAGRSDGYAVYGREVTPGFLYQATSAMERCLNKGVVEMNFDFDRHERETRAVRAAPRAPAYEAV